MHEASITLSTGGDGSHILEALSVSVRGEGHVVDLRGGAGRLLEVVCLVHARFECTFVESQVIVLFTGIRTCLSIDVRSDFVRIAKLVKCLIVRSLEVVVDHATLLLLA